MITNTGDNYDPRYPEGIDLDDLDGPSFPWDEDYGYEEAIV